MQKFEPVNANAGVGNGTMKIVRGSKLITISNGEKSSVPLESGTVLTGIFNGSTPNKFEEDRVDYTLREEDGTLVILAQTAALKQQLDDVNVGELVQITYKGKREITRKNGAKAEMHDFAVGRAINAE